MANMGTMQPSTGCVGPANYDETGNAIYTGSSTGIGAVGPTVPVYTGGSFGTGPAWGTLAPTSLRPTAPGMAMVFPPPSGINMLVQYTTPNGTLLALEVDQAYVQIINDISMQHQMLLNQRHGYLGPSPFVFTRPPPPPAFEDGPAPRMLDGDFSEDEMEKAEQIIAELDGVAA